MKSTKTTSGIAHTGPYESALTREIKQSMAPAQLAALEEIATALGDPMDRGTAALKVLSVGLFALGLDRAGDFCLAELTDALYGKGSDAAAEVFNGITNAGDNALDVWLTVEHAARVRTFAKAGAEATS